MGYMSVVLLTRTKSRYLLFRVIVINGFYLQEQSRGIWRRVVSY